MAAFSETEDLEAVWREALQQYVNITEKPLSYQGERTFDLITRDIAKDLDKSQSGNRGKAKRVIMNVMTFLQKFGDVISQGTSVVFGGSKHCWNAISFIITVAKNYQEILDGFVALMERSGAFLEQLNIYLSEKSQAGHYLDPRLRKTAYKALSHFLTVLANSYQLANSKWRKFKMVVGIVLFNDDAGVGGAQAQLENLVGDLTNKTIAVILKDVEGMAKLLNRSHDEIIKEVEQTGMTVAQIKQNQDARDLERSRKQTLAAIRRHLYVADGDNWATEHHEFTRSGKRVDGTAEWLFKNVGFKRWSEAHQHNPVILLTGPANTGKTHLCGYVIDELLRRYSSPKSATYIAYYYFRRDAPDESIEKCLGSIIYQLATMNNSYASAVLSVCEQTKLNGNNVWDKLVTDLSSYLTGVFFLVVDGFHRREGEYSSQSAISRIVEQLIKAGEQSDFRIFLSLRDEDKLDVFPESDGKAKGVPEIMLGMADRLYGIGALPQNWPDLVIYARAGVSRICDEDSDLARFLTDHLTELPRRLAMRVNWDYQVLQRRLDELAQVSSDQEFKALMDRLGNKENNVVTTIKLLESTLDAEDVEILNVLLIWTTAEMDLGSLQYVRSLERVLKLSLKKNVLLRKKIESKFAALLKVERKSFQTLFNAADEGGGRVELISPTIREVFESTGRIHKRTRRAIFSNQYLNEAYGPLVSTGANDEAAIIRGTLMGFLGTPLYDALCERFDLESQLNLKSDGRIHAPDMNTTRLQILSTCLEMLNSSPTKNDYDDLKLDTLTALGQLFRGIDVENADRTLLSNTGDLLGAFLGDPAIIDKVWTGTFRMFKDGDDFVLHTADLSILWERWLKHIIVAGGYISGSSEAHKWVASAVIKSDGGDHVFSRVASRLVVEWYNKLELHYEEDVTKYERQDLFYFKAAFGAMGTIWYGSEDTLTPNIHQMLRFTQWAKRQLPDGISDFEWELLKANVFLLYDDNQIYCGGIASLERASEQSDDCSITVRLLRILIAAKDYPKALKRAQAFMRTSSVQSTPAKTEPAKFQREFELLYAQALFAVGDYDAAEDVLTQVLNSYSADETAEPTPCGQIVQGSKFAGEALERLAQLWKITDRPEKALKLMKNWHKNDPTGKSIRFQFLNLPATSNFHDCIATAATRGKCLGVIAEVYSQALLDPLPTDGFVSQLAALKHFAFCFKFHAHPDQDDGLDGLEKLVEELTADLEIFEKRPYERGLIWRSVNSVSRYLLYRVSNEGQQSKSFSKLKKLEQAWRKVDGFPASLEQLHLQTVLARAQFLAGDKSSAIRMLKPVLTNVLRGSLDAEEAQKLEASMMRLARIFVVLDDDDNAQAALSLVINGNHTASDEDSSNALGLSAAQYLCTRCERPWRNEEKVFVCKNCPNTIICPECHAQLQSGRLSVLVCEKDHSLLEFPSDRDPTANAMSPRSISVKGNRMSLDAWIKSITSIYIPATYPLKSATNPPSTSWSKGSKVAQYQAVRVISNQREIALKRKEREQEVLRLMEDGV